MSALKLEIWVKFQASELTMRLTKLTMQHRL